VILAWSAVYAYVCAYFLLVYGRRRSDREYLSFGLLAGAFAVYALASALLTSAETPRDAAFAMKVGAVGLLVAIPFLVEFTSEVVGRRTHLGLVAYAWAAFGLVGVVFDIFYDDRAPLPTPALELPMLARDYVSIGVTTPGRVYLALGFALAGAAAFQLLRGAFLSTAKDAIERRHLKMLTFSACVNVLAAGHDVIVRMHLLRSTYLLEHTGMIFVFAMSYVLLDRFVHAADQLRVRTGELARAYDELRLTQERLVRKEQLAAVGELSAVIAHEVRNPLAVIKNAVSGLRRDGTSGDDRSTLLDILDEETDRLNRLMHDLLAYARPVVPKGRLLRVDELVRRAVDRARSAIAREADLLRVTWDLEGPEHVHGDPELLRHALVNVIENAIQAMNAEGELTVRSRDATLGDHPACALSFSDTGEGMDTLVRAKARSPFFTTRPSGTGLGLAIVERVVRNHGGEVAIESRHGVGTTITFVLPIDRISTIPAPEPREGRISGIREAP